MFFKGFSLSLDIYGKKKKKRFLVQMTSLGRQRKQFSSTHLFYL